jgi:hypothetical protein
LPSARSNLLRLDPAELAPGELYLWAWCEMYLRYETFRRSMDVTHAIVIRTEELEDAAAMSRAFDALDLKYLPIKTREPINTNRERGLPRSLVSRDDILLFERFLDRLPPPTRDRIPYLADYDPWTFHQVSR